MQQVYYSQTHSGSYGLFTNGYMASAPRPEPMTYRECLDLAFRLGLQLTEDQRRVSYKPEAE